MFRRLILIALISILVPVGCDAPSGNEPNTSAEQPHSTPTDDEPNTPDANEVTPLPDDEPEEDPNVLVTDPETVADPNDVSPDPNEPRWEEGDFEEAFREVRALEEQARFSQAMRLVFKMQRRFRGHPRIDELKGTLARLRDHREMSASVPFALANLTSKTPTERLTAARTIRDAGDTGLIHLRKTLRNNDGDLAVEAARWLGEWQDDKALPILLDKLQGKPSEAMHTVITAALADWETPLPASILKGLLPLVEKDDSFRQIELAAALAKAAGQRADGDANRFNELLDDNDAFATVRAYLKMAAKSDNVAASAVATKYAGMMGLYKRGLRGEYFHGDSFDKRVMVRIDPAINFPDDDGSQFKYPQGRKTEISIRWTGLLAVPKDGEYTFVAGSDDGKRIWIDGKKVLDDWTDQGMDEETFKVKLSAGLVPIRIDYYQGDGGAGMVLKWTMPGQEKAKVIGPDHLRVKLTPDDAKAGNGAE